MSIIINTTLSLRIYNKGAWRIGIAPFCPASQACVLGSNPSNPALLLDKYMCLSPLKVTERSRLFLHRFLPDRTTPRNRLFYRRIPEITPEQHAGYSYAHAHIAQIWNTKEHCVHDTDHFDWHLSTTHLIKYIHCNYCMYTFRFRINTNLVKESSFRINAKLVTEELMAVSFS